MPSSPSDPQLAAQLRMAIARMARRLRQESDMGGDTSPTLTAALATLEREGPLTPSALAERERIQRPTATRAVARLEAARLVTRTGDPADGRVSHVAIAPAGRALLKRIRSRKNEYLARRLRELTAAEQATLAQAAAILERLLEEEPGSRRTHARGEPQQAPQEPSGERGARQRTAQAALTTRARAARAS